MAQSAKGITVSLDDKDLLRRIDGLIDQVEKLIKNLSSGTGEKKEQDPKTPKTVSYEDFAQKYWKIAPNSDEAVRLNRGVIDREAAKLLENNDKRKPEVTAWQELAKLEASNKFGDGFVLAAKKFTDEWDNTATVAGKTFDTLTKNVQLLGTTAVDAIFGDAKFRADDFLRDLSKQLLQLAMNAAIGSLFKGIFGSLDWFDDGGYTGNGGINQVAGLVHGKEYVLNAAATRSIGVDTLNALNASGSLASLFSGRNSAAAPVLAAAGNVVNVNVENRANAQVGVNGSTNSDGSLNINILVDAMDGALADRAARGRSSFARAMEGRAMRNGSMPGFRV